MCMNSHPTCMNSSFQTYIYIQVVRNRSEWIKLKDTKKVMRFWKKWLNWKKKLQWYFNAALWHWSILTSLKCLGEKKSATASNVPLSTVRSKQPSSFSGSVCQLSSTKQIFDTKSFLSNFPFFFLWDFCPSYVGQTSLTCDYVVCSCLILLKFLPSIKCLKIFITAHLLTRM